MKLYRIKWYVNDKIAQTREEAYWCDSDLEDTWNKQSTTDGMLRYEYEYIKDIKLPDDLFDFSNYKC